MVEESLWKYSQGLRLLLEDITMVEESLFSLIEVVSWLDLVVGSSIRNLGTFKRVEYRLLKYSHMLKISFGRPHNGQIESHWSHISCILAEFCCRKHYLDFWNY